MLKNILVGVAVVVALVALGVALNQPVKLGGASSTDNYSLYSLHAGVNVGDGTNVSKYKCATATFDPGSLATSTITNATTSDIALAGAAVGDICSASLTSATTSAVSVRCAITGAATATISVANLGTTNAAIDLGSGTAKVCFTH